MPVTSEQRDMFASPESGSPRITLEIKGTVPSFKNNKMLIPVPLRELKEALARGDLSGARKALAAMEKKRPLLITKPEYQQAMEAMIASIVSQLRSVFRTEGERICPGNSIQSWIASSMPADDCWTKIPGVVVTGKLCQPGEEGATVVIERL